MAIRLVRTTRVAGVEKAAGAVLSLNAALEAQLVADGAATPFIPKAGRRAILLADSIGSISEVSLSITTLTDNGNGTAAVNMSGGHGSAIGQPVRIAGAPSQGLNALDGVVLSVQDSTNMTVSLDGRKSQVLGSSPTIHFPHRRGCRGFLTALELLLGEQFDTTWCAIGGARARHVLQVGQESAAGQYFVAFVCAGMNDIYASGNPIDTCIADLKALIDFAAGVAKHVFVLGVPPRATGGAWTAEKQTVHTQLNQWASWYADAMGLYFVDTYRAAWNGATYVNAAATEPEPAAAMTFDGTHPSMTGALAIASSIKSYIAPLLGERGWRPTHPDHVGVDVANILSNPTFATHSSGVPTGWALTNITTNASAVSTNPPVARTVANDGDALGAMWEVTFNYGTATGTASFRMALSASIHALLTAGKKLRVRVPFRCTGMVGVTSIALLVQGTIGATGATWQVYANGADSNTDVLSGSLEGVLQCGPALIPEGITACTPFITVSFTSGQSTNGVMRIWHPIFEVSE